MKKLLIASTIVLSFNVIASEVYPLQNAVNALSEDRRFDVAVSCYKLKEDLGMDTSKETELKMSAIKNFFAKSPLSINDYSIVNDGASRIVKGRVSGVIYGLSPTPDTDGEVTKMLLDLVCNDTQISLLPETKAFTRFTPTNGGEHYPSRPEYRATVNKLQDDPQYSLPLRCALASQRTGDFDTAHAKTQQAFTYGDTLMAKTNLTDNHIMAAAGITVSMWNAITNNTLEGYKSMFGVGDDEAANLLVSQYCQ
ncbi:TPA: hypothetical protein ACN33D_004614 [Vibrio parahaemolyticus]